MMIFLLIIAGLIIVGAVAFLVINPSQKEDPRLRYLKALAKFCEGVLEPLEDMENSFQVKFKYEGREFVYEDVEDSLMQSKVYKGFLKTHVPILTSLSFTEKPRTNIRLNISSLSEYVGGGGEAAQPVRPPKQLSEFTVSTNKPDIVTKLFEKEDVVAVFARFKNQDHRGHPSMSLDIVQGILTLRFYAGADLRPSLFDIQQNVTLMDEYLAAMTTVLRRLETLQIETR